MAGKPTVASMSIVVVVTNVVIVSSCPHPGITQTSTPGQRLQEHTVNVTLDPLSLQVEVWSEYDGNYIE